MRLYRAARCAAVVFAVSGMGSALALEPTAPLKVTGGLIAGEQADGLRIYRGIPFAAPPVGQLRWRAPQPVLPWDGVKPTRQFSAACAQTAAWITLPKSEDCLYLNVWAPAKARKLPVMVWIHGGGYYGGTAAQPIYDGANLARQGAIVVTVNYRLGVLGFFAHPELSAESPHKAAGNQAIHDHLAALRWVQDNIAKFGGDPSRVTVMGESAGGASVQALVASPLAKGLLHRAITQSGSWAVPLNARESAQYDRARAEAQGVAFAKSVGAASLADLRALPVEALHKPQWDPQTVLDGYLLREDFPTMYAHGRHNDVPLLAGWNADEGKDLAAAIIGSDAFTAANHRAMVAKLLGYAPSEQDLARYPSATDAQAKASIHQLTTDWWGWRTAHWAALQAKHGRAKSYVYFFAHLPAEPATPCGYGCGAGHGAEIPYMFHNLEGDGRRWTAADRALETRLSRTWVSFAATGDPNGKGLPAWPAYDGSNDTIMRIGASPELLQSQPPDFSQFR